MKIRMALLAGAMVLSGTANLMAGDNPIETRQELMQAAKAAAKASGAMMKGEMPYDPVTAELAMRSLYAVAVGFGHQFPEDTKGDPDSEALDKIWDDSEGFMKAAAKFEADALAAIKPADDGMENFGPAFGKVAENCKSCHDAYRLKKK